MALWPRGGGGVNIKMLSCQWRNCYYKDKMVSRPFYFHNGNSHIWKDGLCIATRPSTTMMLAIAKLWWGTVQCGLLYQRRVHSIITQMLNVINQWLLLCQKPVKMDTVLSTFDWYGVYPRAINVLYANTTMLFTVSNIACKIFSPGRNKLRWTLSC